MLVGALGAVRVSVGENFRFGNRAKGDTGLLAADGRFQTTVHPLLEVEGEIVSSSHIRGLVLAGEVDQATRFLGAPFQLRGEVVRGDERGRTLDFPTANLIPEEELVCPGHGIYACLADGHPAAVNVGVRPTFTTGRGELIEAYLLDFDGDLYGSELRIDFLRRLRGERRFATPEALIEQMHSDVELTREVVAEREGGAASASVCLRYDDDHREKARARREVRRKRARHRKHEGAGGAADRAHQPPHRAPARAEERPPLAPRVADAGGSPPALPGLPAAQRPRGLPRAHQRARPAQVNKPA